jgi:hypothetical protein
MQQNVLMVLSSEFSLALIVQFRRWTYATLELNQQLEILIYLYSSFDALLNDLLFYAAHN